MTITNGYCTLDEFKRYLTSRGGTIGTDSTDDTAIEDIIEGVSRYIDRECNRFFYITAAAETRYFTPVDGDLCFIDDLPATSDITSIKVDDGSRDYATTLASTDIDFCPDNAEVRGVPYTWIEIAPHADESFYTYRRGVQIISYFGWKAVPDDIRQACLAICLNIYQSKTGQSAGGSSYIPASSISSRVSGSGVVIRPNEVPTWAMAILRKYQRLTT